MISGRELLSGLRAGDPTALAGVDYDSLAEDHDIDEDAVVEALSNLRTTA